MTMQQIIQQFQDEVMEAHLRKLRAEDEEYQEIEKELFHMETLHVVIPYEKVSVLDYIHTNGKVHKQEYKEDGIEVDFSIQQDLIHRVDRLLRI